MLWYLFDQKQEVWGHREDNWHNLDWNGGGLNSYTVNLDKMGTYIQYHKNE